TVAQLQEKQRMAAAEGDDQDVFGYHYENDMLAVNVFHLRGGKILDRREFFWEELPEIGKVPEVAGEGACGPQVVEGEGDGGRGSALSAAGGAVGPQTSLFHPGEFFSALMKQVYIDQQYVPRNILAPVDFEDRTELEELLSEKRGSKVEIL